MTVTGINVKYAVASNQLWQQFPAIQANNYQPRSLDEQIDFCVSEESYLLMEDSKPLFNTEIIQCYFGRESVLMHKIISPVRWVFLTMPRIFLLDKKTKEISYPQKGMRLAGTNKVTVAKCFLACLAENNLILDAEGKPQIFTLKLTSSKTELVGYGNSDSEMKTLMRFNSALQKHYKVKGNFNLLHLASLKLIVYPKEFVSRGTNDSSLGVMFSIDGSGQSLSEQQQQQVFELISSEEIQAIFDDPFRLKQSQASQPQSVSSLNNLEDVDF